VRAAGCCTPPPLRFFLRRPTSFALVSKSSGATHSPSAIRRIPPSYFEPFPLKPFLFPCAASLDCTPVEVAPVRARPFFRLLLVDLLLSCHPQTFLQSQCSSLPGACTPQTSPPNPLGLGTWFSSSSFGLGFPFSRTKFAPARFVRAKGCFFPLAGAERFPAPSTRNPPIEFCFQLWCPSLHGEDDRTWHPLPQSPHHVASIQAACCFLLISSRSQKYGGARCRFNAKGASLISLPALSGPFSLFPGVLLALTAYVRTSDTFFLLAG